MQMPFDFSVNENKEKKSEGCFVKIGRKERCNVFQG